MKWTVLLTASLVLPWCVTATALGGSDTALEPIHAAALTRALDSIQPDRIRKDLEYVACDEMGGRDTPSLGQRLTARFLVNRLQRIGFQPGFQGGFLYPYHLESHPLQEEGNRAVIVKGSESTTLDLGRDYYFFAQSPRTQRLSAKVVWAGDGAMDDVRAKDRWVAFHEGENSWMQVAQAAAAEGALGILAIAPEEGDEDFRRRMKSSVDRMKVGSVSWPSSGNESGGSRRSRFPDIGIVRLTHEAGEKLLAMGPKRLKQGDDLGVTFLEERNAGDGDGLIEVENVCGFWPGSDPKLSREVIILSAHYDHVGVSGDGQVYNGADDNGSGTTGLLALAEALVAYGPMDRSVMLIWVSGEEKGLYGSKAWSENPWLPDGCKPIGNINIDMIGRNAPDKLLITPTKEGRYADQYNGLVRMAEALGPEEGFPSLGSADDYYRRSDHANFARLDIPVTFLFSDVHEDYHKVTDTPDKIDYDKIHRVVRLVMRMLDQVNQPELEL